MKNSSKREPPAKFYDIGSKKTTPKNNRFYDIKVKRETVIFVPN